MWMCQSVLVLNDQRDVNRYFTLGKYTHGFSGRPNVTFGFRGDQESQER